MSQNAVIFAGLDTGLKRGLWISDGTSGGTFQINVSNAGAAQSIHDRGADVRQHVAIVLALGDLVRETEARRVMAPALDTS